MRSVGEESTLDGENKEEEDSDELPAAGADGLFGTAQHDAEIAHEEQNHGQGNGGAESVGMERDKEAETQTDKEGIGAGGYAKEEDREPARNVVGRKLLLLFAESGEEKTQRHRNQQTEIDEAVVFGEPYTEQITYVKSCKQEQCMDHSDEEGHPQTMRETDGGLQRTGTQGEHDGDGERKGEDDVF